MFGAHASKFHMRSILDMMIFLVSLKENITFELNGLGLLLH